jgi:ferredoxin
MPIKVDKDLCVGCGACAGICPSSFTIGDDGKADSLGDSDCAMNAIESCPVQAISAD